MGIGKTEVVTFRVRVDLAAAWREAATSAGVPFAKYVAERAMRTDQSEEIAALTRQCAAQAKKIASLTAAIADGTRHVAVGPVLSDPVPRNATGEVTPRLKGVKR